MRLLAAALIALVATTIAHASDSAVKERVKWALWVEGVSELRSEQMKPAAAKTAPARDLPEEIAVALIKFGL